MTQPLAEVLRKLADQVDANNMIEAEYSETKRVAAGYADGEVAQDLCYTGIRAIRLDITICDPEAEAQFDEWGRNHTITRIR